MAYIYCDEAGNSGQNLLDAKQPFFVLASNDYGAAEALELLEHVRTRQQVEAKFSALRKSPSGTQRLLAFLADPRLNKHRVVVDLYDKRYMIATKLVDLVMETVLHERGVNIYERGANIATANLLHMCLPKFTPPEIAESFLAAFARLIRERSAESLADYLRAAADAVAACTNEDFAGLLRPFARAELVDTWLEPIGVMALEPAIPALFMHISVWSKRKTDRLQIVHDQSKPIVEWDSVFHAMMADADESSSNIGYGERAFAYPLRAASLTHANSKAVPQLQVADLCAGAINHWLKNKHAGELDPLAEAIEALPCKEWVVNAVLPSLDVTPAELGTEDAIGPSPVDAMAEQLARRRRGL